MARRLNAGGHGSAPAAPRGRDGGTPGTDVGDGFGDGGRGVDPGDGGGPRATGALDPHEPWVVVHRGSSVLVSGLDGNFSGTRREGLFDEEARVLSKHRLQLGGHGCAWGHPWVVPPDRVSHRSEVRLATGDARGPRLPEDEVEIRIDRRVGLGMLEEIVLTNHSMAGIESELVLDLDADFTDVMVVSGDFPPLGQVAERWDECRALVFEYRAEANGRSVRRASRVRIARSTSPPVQDGRSLRFAVSLAPRGQWSALLVVGSRPGDSWREPEGAGEGRSPFAPCSNDEARARWRARRAHFGTAGRVLAATCERAADDLFDLRIEEGAEEGDAFVPQAGMPVYTAFFGRDTVSAAVQGALLGPEMLRGVLARLAATQATEDDPWRDAEPGKMVHEVRRGPRVQLGLLPHDRYYGTLTTGSMFVVALSEYWHWTGDTAALRRHQGAARRVFDWVDRSGDADGDGFVEYDRRSPKGLKNHGWKDSDEAIRYEDGRLVENPIAPLTEQAYLHLALERMAEILLVLGDGDGAAGFEARAAAMRRRFHRAFWMPDEGFYAMALDAAKRPVRSIGSDPGHALMAGLVPVARARAVADRLLRPDLFSGWGVRTLSNLHPSYNPNAYHLGTVWPVENAAFVLGFKRYGLSTHAERLATAVMSAAGHFRFLRLPELIGGHSRDEWGIPTLYPNANAPQAWSASAVVGIVQALLGIYAFAPARVLALVDPQLPPWVDSLTLRGLRVGDARLDLRFRRRPDGSASHRLLRREGRVLVVPVPPPQGIRSERSLPEALLDWAVRRAPGRTAHAARLAIGIVGDDDNRSDAQGERAVRRGAPPPSRPGPAPGPSA
ncbi:hypothetical protein L6R50_05080 [Myxococcota bacterium]|nr:hypothetical protein [Myxococcota bacterium]